MLEKIKSLPDSPGVYQYFDQNNRLLYIGKAKSLKKRVKSYFRFTPTLTPNPNLSPRIIKMLSETISLHYIVVESEHDALILENSLIKQLKPKYNILLRDDKTYPYIYLDLDEPFPFPQITRKVVKGKNIKYFGPFSSGSRDLLKTLYEELPLVQSKSCLKGTKTCLYYQLQKCLGPCAGLISSQEYQNIVQQSIAWISDKEIILSLLQQKMEKFSEDLRFEEAGEILTRIRNIENAQLFSHVDIAKLDDMDIFVVEEFGKRAVVIRVFVRDGKVVSSNHNLVNLQNGIDKNALYTQAILEFYGFQTPFNADKILVGEEFEDRKLLAETLSEGLGKKTSIITATTHERKKLITLALINAQEIIKNQTKAPTLPEEIQTLFGLENIPYKIEVIDTSHHRTQAPVASKIVYENGSFKKEEYRHYTLTTRDEYSQMREVITKRVESFDKISPPDLFLIDGGKGQINLVKEIVESVGANVDILGIAKEKIDAKAHRAKGSAHDTIYAFDETYKLAPSDKRLQLLQKLRDEAHRFAIEFHRKQKRKEDKEISLLEIKGIGKAKVQKLINYFGTFEKIKGASFEELSRLLNRSDAEKIREKYD